jgi:hypothetical protein
MIIKSLFVVIKILNGVDGVHEQVITRAFEQQCQIIAKNLPPEAFIIDVNILTAAIKLVEYFNNHKLILSAYECNPDTDFINNLNNIFKTNSSRRIPTQRFAGIPSRVLDNMRRVFEMRRSMTNPKLLGNNNLERDTANQCFTRLQSLRLGRLYQVKALNGVVVDHFVRISAADVKSDLSLAQAIIDLGCDITTVIENLEGTEANETRLLDPEIRKRAKRPHNNDETDIGHGSKKFKIFDDDNLIRLPMQKGHEFIFNEALVNRLIPNCTRNNANFKSTRKYDRRQHQHTSTNNCKFNRTRLP